jgi:hypothetical protein
MNFRERKAAAEEAIRQSMEMELRAFQAATGICPTGVSVTTVTTEPIDLGKAPAIVIPEIRILLD